MKQFCLPRLIENCGELIQPYLTEEEVAFVVETCGPYAHERSESVSHSKDSLEEVKDISEEEIGESPSKFRRKLSNEVVFEKRQDVNMWKAIKLLFSKPGIRKEVKILINEVRNHLCITNLFILTNHVKREIIEFWIS